MPALPSSSALIEEGVPRIYEVTLGFFQLDLSDLVVGSDRGSTIEEADSVRE